MTRLLLTNISYHKVAAAPIQLHHLTTIAIVPSFALSTHSPAIPLALLSALLNQPNLTTLALVLIGTKDAPLDYVKRCLSMIAKRAHKLKKCTFDFRGLSNLEFGHDDLKNRVGLIFAQFTGLRELDVTLLDTLLLERLPKSTKLVTIECTGFTTARLDDQQSMILSALAQHLVGLFEGEAKLEGVTMEFTAGNFEGWCGFEDIAGVCEKKGIELRWIGAWDPKSSGPFPCSKLRFMSPDIGIS